MRLMACVTSCLLLCAVVLVLPAFAATFTRFDNFAAYEAALGGFPLNTQNFEGFAIGDNLNGVEFLPGISVTSNLPKVEVFDAIDDQVLFAFGTSERGQGGSFYDINFSQPYNAVGFNIESFDPATAGPAILEIFFDDQTSVSIDIFPTNATEDDPIFFGVIAETPIARIRLTEGPEIVGFEGNEEVALDDFVIASTLQPEPDLQPNLQPTGITFDPSTVGVGDTVFFDSGVRNTGSVDSGIFNVKWLVNNQEVGAAGSHARVPAGQTVLDGNSQFSWTFDSPGTYSVSFTVDFDNQIEESNEGDNTGSVQVTVTDSVLEGTDANGDGVWDDIEVYIDQTYPDPTTRAALRAIAVAMQSAMLVANDPAASVNAATALQRAIECLYFVRPDDARAVKNDVKAVLLNTLERSKAYLQFSDQLGGQIFPSTPLSELQSACNF